MDQAPPISMDCLALHLVVLRIASSIDRRALFGPML